MKDFLKCVSLIFIGLVAAVVVYPLMHEIGHAVFALMLGVRVHEFNILPIPNVLCEFNASSPKSIVFVALGGVAFPVVLTAIRPPKKFYIWYLWISVNVVCLLSFSVSLWALIFYKTKFEITNNDMTMLMHYMPKYLPIYLFVIISLSFITLFRLLRSGLLKNCIKYFEL